MNRRGDRALVIGGSIAGLIPARVLSDYFDHVVILERDTVEDLPSFIDPFRRAITSMRCSRGARMCAPLSAQQEEPLRSAYSRTCSADGGTYAGTVRLLDQGQARLIAE
jgi:hypothetical protein